MHTLKTITKRSNSFLYHMEVRLSDEIKYADRLRELLDLTKSMAHRIFDALRPCGGSFLRLDHERVWLAPKCLIFCVPMIWSN